MDLLDGLPRQTHGLVLAASGTDWDLVAAGLARRCDSVYSVGPPAAPALREALRRDAHGLLVRGPVDPEVFGIALNAALSGSLVVVELQAEQAEAVLDAARDLAARAAADPAELPGALLGIIGAGETWSADERARRALTAGDPSDRVLRGG